MKITKKDIESHEGLIMVDFMADWCGPCKMISPTLEILSKEYNIKLIKINVDSDSELASEFNVRGIPTIIFFKNGIVKETIVGNVPKSKIEQIINQWKIE